MASGQHSLSIIRETSFNRGYNDKVAPEHLQKGFLADALNCFIRTDEIKKRTGYSIIGSDLGLNKACQGIKGVRFANGTKEVIFVFNGSIYKWTGSGNLSLITSGSGVLSTSAYVDIVVANNNVYFFDGVSAVAKYDGTSISSVAGMPHGQFAKWYHNILAVGGINGSPNNVQLSDLGNPEAFSSGIATTIAINPNDGDYLTGFGTLNDELITFKTNRIWSLSGYGTASLTVSNLSERISGVGTLSYRSIVNTGSDILYISFLGDVPHIRSLQRTRYGTTVDGGIISDPIETSMNGINKSKIDMTCGIFDGRNAWFAVPLGSSTTNNGVFMYDVLNNGWVRHTGINASCFETFSIGTTVQMYFGESSATSKAYVFDGSTSDNGTAINFQVISRRYGGQSPERINKYKFLQITARETGNYNLTVDYSVDGFSYDNLGLMNLSGTGSIFDNIILDASRLGGTDVRKKRFTLPKVNKYYVQFKLHDSLTTSSVTLRDWELLYFPRTIREAM